MKYRLILIMFWIAQSAAAQQVPKAPIIAKTALARRDTTTEADTSKENEEPRYYYLSVNTNVFVNTKGGFSKRFAPAVEFGRTYGIFDIGLASGMTNTLHADTARYLHLIQAVPVGAGAVRHKRFELQIIRGPNTLKASLVSSRNSALQILVSRRLRFVFPWYNI